MLEEHRLVSLHHHQKIVSDLVNEIAQLSEVEQNRATEWRLSALNIRLEAHQSQVDFLDHGTELT